MNPSRIFPRRFSLPIAAQVMVLLLGGLVVAQATTLALTLLLPPSPHPQHSLAEVARALRGGPLDQTGPRSLVRTIESAPPSTLSANWLVSQRSTAELARLLGADESNVRLLFYAPPPLAGAEAQPDLRRLALGDLAGPQPRPRLVLASMALGPRGGAGPAPFGPGPGGGPGGGSGGWASGPTGRAGPVWQASGPPAAPGGQYGSGGDGDAPSFQPGPQFGGAGPGPEVSQAAGGGAPGFGLAKGQAQGQAPGSAPGGAFAGAHARPWSPLEAAVFAASYDAAAPARPSGQAGTAPAGPPAVVAVAPAPQREARAQSSTPAAAASAPPTPRPPPTRAAAPQSMAAGRPLPDPVGRSLFGVGPAPYVEGEFVAAWQVAPGRWVTVRPRPEGFPNSWQRRVLLWFAVSFAIVAPIGYLFARRLTAPLRIFAAAADRFGRDPTAEVFAAEGPAEVGLAARAFNLMRQRLRRHVEDRNGMIGSISHDLRTPLARMRFRLARATPELREGMERDILQMEEMITSVLTFLRDGADRDPRQRLDLRSLLECVVDDLGFDAAASLEPGETVEVEADATGLRRVFDNLVDNALKYGDEARIRLSVVGGEAVAEIRDSGPGLADDELEQVFKPFYRTASARASSKGGIGLGLAVSRSIIRAHGGELTLIRGDHGLVAEVRLPLAAAPTLASGKTGRASYVPAANY
ncbi:MAG: HAMP domain-containing sensor histidine kinase [Caulobacteraceae bacterium]|nr:HAMP domain-containing sensor histidine kinase [Caulobacteraceae bacterium]